MIKDGCTTITAAGNAVLRLTPCLQARLAARPHGAPSQAHPVAAARFAQAVRLTHEQSAARPRL